MVSYEERFVVLSLRSVYWSTTRRIERLLHGRGDNAQSSRIDDLFESGYPRRALLSYLVEPLLNRSPPPHRHTNILEVQAWAEALHYFKCRVDVIDCRETTAVPDSADYNYVAGFGEPLEYMLRTSRRVSTKYIFYGTGCHPVFRNRASIEQKVNFFQRYGVWPRIGGREDDGIWWAQALVSDRYIVLGNRFVADTYADQIVSGEISSLDGFYLENDLVRMDKVFGEESRRNLLWFGSAGCVHKGLITVLEALRSLPECRLHILGLADHEREQLGLDSLFKDLADRVQYHGFLVVGSGQLRNVVAQTGIVVFPSASEGGAPGLLTAVAIGGGYPVLSRATGIDLKESKTIENPGCVDEIVDAVQSLIDLPLDEYRQRCAVARAEVVEGYSYDRYKQALRDRLQPMFEEVPSAMERAS